MKEKRQDEIMELLRNDGILKTTDLVEYFQVSLETIRRDIAVLVSNGYVKKVYGGIRLAEEPEQALPSPSIENWSRRAQHCHEEKLRIAHKALEYIQPHSIIAIDIGTSAYELARLLKEKEDLSIITTSLSIAGELARNTMHRVYCIGGLVDQNEIVTVGSFTELFLENFASIDLFISGADGITAKTGVTEFHENIDIVKKQLIAKAGRTIVLADHEKFGRDSLFVSCRLNQVNSIITDAAAPAQIIAEIRKQGIDVDMV